MYYFFVNIKYQARLLAKSAHHGRIDKNNLEVIKLSFTAIHIVSFTELFSLNFVVVVSSGYPPL